MSINYVRPELELPLRETGSASEGTHEFARTEVTVGYFDTADFIIQNGEDPAIIIEEAWAWLNTQGGGILRTRGLGETWTIQTQINSQGANVTWQSDWGLTIRAMDALNLSIVLVTHDHVTIEGVRFDGNKANQGVPDGSNICGIEIAPASYWKVLRCVFYNIRQYGFWSHSAAAEYGGEIGGCICDGCGWNGISIGTNTYDATVHDCLVSHSSDVGIAVMGIGCLVSDCVVRDMDGVDGAVNSQWCFGFEGTATMSSFEHCEAHGISIQGFNFGGSGYNGLYDCLAEGLTTAGIYIITDYNKVTSCTVKDCAVYDVYVASGANHNHIEDCDVYNLTQAITAWNGYIHVLGSYTTIQDTRVWSATAQNQIYGIKIDGTTENPIILCEIDGCRIWGFSGVSSMAVNLQNNADNNWVINNIIHDCNRGIQINAAADANNSVLDNEFYNITLESLLDGGTDTVLPSVRACFMKELGTAVWIVTAASAMGIDVDAADEGALAKIKLPPTLHQVVRVIVWGTAQVDEADGMQLQVAAGAGGDNEAWNAEVIAVATKTSASLNFVNLDNIYWVFTSADDTDIGHLLAGDFLQWCCYYAAASGVNCATDLLLAGEALEIQYV